jgi:Na+-transporting NADH:ubiquinone oxidoreductase subunit A
MIDHHLKKGYTIKLAGKARPEIAETKKPKLFALQPNKFPGVKPKLDVDIGEEVQIGTTLFHDKNQPNVKFVSPACGKIIEINRGERRTLLEIVIERDGKEESIDFGAKTKEEIQDLNVDEIKKLLLAGGVWPYIRQRPFAKIANPEVKPRDIFISAMDSAPLAPEQKILLKDTEEYLQMGIDILNKFTDGNIYLSVNGDDEELYPMFNNLYGVERHRFFGKHPVGNISVHIHHIAPIKVGDIVWTVNAVDLVEIGKFLLSGTFPTERIIAVAGSSVKEESRKYYKTWLGANIQSLITEGDLNEVDVRYISSNVLTGRKIPENAYISFKHRMITVIPEGRDREFFGWLSPGLKQESFSRTFLSKFFPSKEYIKDTRIHGGKRAFIQTGDYEKMLPMDILPTHLVKSIIAEDIEEMIALGLLEVDAEDFALCTYICPSKIDFGEYILKGLNILEKEG